MEGVLAEWLDESWAWTAITREAKVPTLNGAVGNREWHVFDGPVRKRNKKRSGDAQLWMRPLAK